MLLSKRYNQGRLRFYTNISHDRLNNSIIPLITFQRKLNAVVSTKYSFRCLKTVIYFWLCNRFGEFAIAIFCIYIHDNAYMCDIHRNVPQELKKIIFVLNVTDLMVSLTQFPYTTAEYNFFKWQNWMCVITRLSQCNYSQLGKSN